MPRSSLLLRPRIIFSNLNAIFATFSPSLRCRIPEFEKIIHRIKLREQGNRLDDALVLFADLELVAVDVNLHWLELLRASTTIILTKFQLSLWLMVIVGYAF